MKIKSTLLLAALTSVLSTSAFANFNISAGYTNLSSDTDDFDVSLNAITLGLGYEFQQPDSKFSFMPEIRFGQGTGSDSVRVYGVSVDVEAESYTAISVRAAYQVSDVVKVYVQPLYANLEIKASYAGYSDTEDSWETGFGAGVNFETHKNWSFDLEYNRFDDTNVFAGNVRYKF